MQIKLGKKKLVIFVADADDILDDDLAKALKSHNPSWTKKECREAADLMKQFGIQIFDAIIQTVTGEINTTESQRKFKQEFDQLKIKLEEFAKRKGIEVKH